MPATTQVAHTPGPWTHKATAGDHDFLIYPEATGRDVALVRDFNEANARLIAAAPDMLEALRQAWHFVHSFGPKPADSTYTIVENALAEAIAKAEATNLTTPVVE